MIEKTSAPGEEECRFRARSIEDRDVRSIVRRSVRLQFKFPAVPAVNKKKLTLCGLVASRNKLSGLFQNRIDCEVTFFKSIL